VLIAGAPASAHSFSSGWNASSAAGERARGLAAHRPQLYGALQQAYDDLRQTQKAGDAAGSVCSPRARWRAVSRTISTMPIPPWLSNRIATGAGAGLKPGPRAASFETIQRAI